MGMDRLGIGISRYTLSSVQFSYSVVSYSLQPHGLQHTRLPCPDYERWWGGRGAPQGRMPIIGSVQSLSRVQLLAYPWAAALQASLSITNSWNLLKLMSIESVMPSNHLTPCWHYFLFSPSLWNYNWHCVSLRCIMCCFDMLIYWIRSFSYI